MVMMVVVVAVYDTDAILPPIHFSIDKWLDIWWKLGSFFINVFANPNNPIDLGW